ncbi:hypothetical protein [Propionivibrio sp.]|uniref:hypothetical protein n=1 Tax=Propionivibrio sp. TaxID=2212460 RepID=UPI0039E3A95F
MLPLLLDLLRRNWLSIALLVAGAAFGAWAAWSIQGVRLDEARDDLAEARQAFTRFKAALALQEEEEAQRADAARRRAADDHRRLSDELEKRIAAGDAYRRCVAAGKCGAVVRDVSAGGCGPTLRSTGRRRT